MKRFCQPVDRRSRAAMTAYLSGHLRYNTMNTWNHSTSYACNIKIHNLGLASEIADKLCEMLDIEAFSDYIHNLICEFGEVHGWRWQAGINGRSGGYLVLYQGEAQAEKHVCYPGRSTDMGEDFTDWTMDELRDRTELVRSFEMLADAIVREALYMAKHYEVREERYYAEHQRKVLVFVT